METRPPFTLTVYDKSFTRRGNVAAPLSVEGAVRKNAAGECAFTVDADHRRIDDLTTPGARVVVEYRYRAKVAKRLMLSGSVSEMAGEGGEGESTRTFTIADDWELFNNLLGWPDPAAPIGSQGSEAKFFTRTGPAETVLKDIVSANAAAEGIPLVVPPSQGRGAVITVATRFHALADKLFPAVDAAGIAVRIVQVDGQLTLDCWVPKTYTRPLTERSGVIAPGAKFSRVAPTVTRVVAATGSADSDVQRAFRLFPSTLTSRSARTPLETAWGFTKTKFLEVSGDDVQLEALMLQQANDELAAGAEKVGLQIELSETPRWRYGKTFVEGDKVPIQLDGAPLMSDYVREVAFSWTPEEDSQITPVVGDWDDSSNAYLIKTVAGIARQARDKQRSQ